MRRETIWTIVAGVIFVGGLSALYFSLSYLTRQDQQRDQEAALAQQQVQLPVDPSFNALPNDDLSFEASAEFIPEEGSPLLADVQYDGRGTIRFAAKQDDELTELYLTPTETIICQALGCFSTPPDPEEPLFDINTFVYGRGDLPDLAQGLVRVGEEPCSSGICDIWTAPAPVEAEDAPRLLIDQSSRTIIQITGTEDGEQISINFEYKDVNIILPVNVEPIEDQDSANSV